MKMAVFLKGNAFCIDGFLTSYFKIDHWSIFKWEMSEKAAKSEETGPFLI